MKFLVQNDKVSFWICKTGKQLKELQVVSVIDIVDMDVDNGSLKDPN